VVVVVVIIIITRDVEILQQESMLYIL